MGIEARADSSSAGRMAGAPWIVGKTVPWSVTWTGETSFDVRPSEDFPGFQEIVQLERQGEGAPVFASMHVTRHRRGMFQHLCHVCGQPTPEGDRYLFPLESGGMVDLGDGTCRYGGSVPPVHGDCAGRARNQCPHLRGFAGVLAPFPQDEGRMIWRTDVVPGMEDLARILPGGQPVILSCYRLHDRPFTDLVQALQAEHGVHRPVAPT
jgi:hypothetical protein